MAAAGVAMTTDEGMRNEGEEEGEGRPGTRLRASETHAGAGEDDTATAAVDGDAVNYVPPPTGQQPNYSLRHQCC